MKVNVALFFLLVKLAISSSIDEEIEAIKNRVHPITIDANNFNDTSILKYPENMNDPNIYSNFMLSEDYYSKEEVEVKYEKLGAFLSKYLREIKLYERLFISRVVFRTLVYKILLGEEPERLTREFKYLYSCVAEELYNSLSEFVPISKIFDLLMGQEYNEAFERALKRYYNDEEIESYKNVLAYER